LTALPHALHHWGTETFAQSLKEEVLALPAGTLPLHHAVSQAGLVDESSLSLTVFGSEEDASSIRANIGVFFTEIVINCGCGAEPMPQHAYCKICVTIDKRNATASFTVESD
jgi:hypothetical protein